MRQWVPEGGVIFGAQKMGPPCMKMSRDPISGHQKWAQKWGPELVLFLTQKSVNGSFIFVLSTTVGKLSQPTVAQDTWQHVERAVTLSYLLARLRKPKTRARA